LGSERDVAFSATHLESIMSHQKISYSWSFAKSV
jgi:hypothetical protein